MKKKIIVLALAGIITISGVSLAYAENRNDIGLNNYNGKMMRMMGSGVQSSDDINKMIDIMNENGFTDEANAMRNGDINTMKKLMTNISEKDYEKMIDIMQNNGYGSMAKMMQSIGKENMVKVHQSMMGS
ncbi:hypothetical protein GKZ28_00125 [Clostridium chromiireducens]|uniref:DUF2680 domain-containing protein n=1 Tax=Clostridium chromiireducens TaxID=225345 RepID=A0A964VZY0_9CLOT|nr:hypothetical protein [Clostridium chromiireducens]MVX62106.1 hypothetical protein [Clostridium chromiireducens]